MITVLLTPTQLGSKMERLEEAVSRLMREIREAFLGVPISHEQVSIEERVQEILWLEVPEPEVSTDARRLAVLK